MLKFLTSILRNRISRDDFIGHIGGDDFIAILSGCDSEALCMQIAADFDESIALFYNQDDIDKGYIVAKNRYGIDECFPLLSIAIVGTSSERYRTIFELSEDIAKLKKNCKQKQGSNFSHYIARAGPGHFFLFMRCVLCYPVCTKTERSDR